MQIACAFEDIGNPVYVQMVKAIERAAASAGYRLVIHSTNRDQDAELAIVGNLSHGYVDGLIISPLRPTEKLVAAIAGAPRPIVAIGQLPTGIPVDTVRVDSGAAAAAVVRHLDDQGCRRIGFINGPADTNPGRRRLDGYRAGISAAGLEDDAQLIESAPNFDFQGGLDATAKLLARTHVDGLFCATDTLAVGAIKALTNLGLSVPGDVAVASIDNTELADLITPALTSIDLMASERATAATELLLDRLQHPGAPPQTWTSEPSLVIRQSSVRRPQHPHPRKEQR
ncbi:LacI family DNA-binding transcriptional regulator [Propionibacteriaceae bacterium G1746]